MFIATNAVSSNLAAKMPQICLQARPSRAQQRNHAKIRVKSMLGVFMLAEACRHQVHTATCMCIVQSFREQGTKVGSSRQIAVVQIAAGQQ